MKSPGGPAQVAGRDPADRADELRAGCEFGHAEAAAIYCEHPDSIAPETAPGRERLLWLLRTGRARPGPCAAAVRRAADRTDDLTLRRAARAALAALELRRGDAMLGERMLVDLLTEVRGTSSADELSACLDLAWSFRRRKHDFEALVMSRRAFAVALRRGAPWWSAVALLYVAASLRDLGAAAGAESAFDDIEAISAELPADRRAQLRRQIAAHRFQLAVARRDATTAAEHLAAWAAEPAGPAAAEVLRVELAEGRARVALLSGRPADAATLADSVRSWTEPTTAPEFHTDLVRAESLLAFGAANACVAVAELVTSLETRGIDVLGAGAAFLAAADLEQVLRDRCACPDEAARIHAFAARAALERVAALDAAMDDLPELSVASETDLALVARHRAEFARRHTEFLNAAARTAPAERARDELAGLVHDDGTIKVCAWCLRAFRPSGRAVPAGHLLTAAAGGALSHGICDGCRAAL